MRLFWLLLLAACPVMTSTGCLGLGVNDSWNIPAEAKENGQLPSNLPAKLPNPGEQTATTGEAVRVAKIGHEILTKNPGLGVHPIFQTTGETKLVLSHKAAKVVVISESLTKQCGEGELAALLADELGRMVVEQESLATRVKPGSSNPRPMAGGMDRDGGSFGPADGVQLAEAAIMSRKSRGVEAAPDLSYGLKTTDSIRLGEEILRRSGFQPEDPAKVRDLRRQSGKGVV